jgi:hypothetical protein
MISFGCNFFSTGGKKESPMVKDLLFVLVTDLCPEMPILSLKPDNLCLEIRMNRSVVFNLFEKIFLEDLEDLILSPSHVGIVIDDDMPRHGLFFFIVRINQLVHRRGCSGWGDFPTSSGEQLA